LNFESAHLKHNNTMEKLKLDQLEAIIDSDGIEETLAALANLCHEKENHIRENWQDESLANEWRKKGNRIQRLSDSMTETINKRFNF